MLVDPLSDALALIEARCVVSGGFTAGGSWGMRFWPQARLKVIAVVRGSCWLMVEDWSGSVLLEAGDVAVVNGWHSVALAHDPAAELAETTQLFTDHPEAVISLSEEDEEEDVAVFGGHIEVGQGGDNLLLDPLPQVTHIRAGASEAHAVAWLLDRILYEMTTGRPGARFAAQQQAQMLFVEILRSYLESASSVPPGWLRATADRQLASALGMMHADPGRKWNLEELAAVATMPRSTFIERFKAAAGVPPLTYLYQWRMRLAERALRERDTPIAALAPSLGYTSESAFSNAFKRAMGVSPRHYRTAQRASGANL